MKNFISLLFAGLLISGCAQSSAEKARGYINKGKEAIGVGYAELNYSNIIDASDYFKKAIEQTGKGKEFCEAHYGLLLSNLLNFLDLVNSLISLMQMTGSLSNQVDFLPKSGGMVDTVVDAIVTPILDTFNEMNTSVVVIENERCSFELSSFPIVIGLKDDPILIAELRGEWDYTEAELIGSMVAMMQAVLNYALSIDLDVNIDEVMNAYNEGVISLNMDDMIGLVRSVGLIPQNSETFLKFHPERYYYYGNVGERFGECFLRIANMIENLFGEQDDNPGDDIIAYTDKSSSGFGGEDELTVNIYDPIENKKGVHFEGKYVPVIDLAMSFVKGLITKNYISSLIDFSRKWGAAFKGTSSDPIYLSEINTLLFNLIEIKDTFRFYPARLFPQNANVAKPPRDLLPYWSDIDGNAYAEFIVEGEYPGDSTETKPYYIKKGDSKHFPDTITFENKNITGLEIKKDCIYPEGGDVILPYIAFQDPSFNNSIEINLGPLNTTDCPETDEWKTADRYSLNKAINDMVKVILELADTLQGMM